MSEHTMPEGRDQPAAPPENTKLEERAAQRADDQDQGAEPVLTPPPKRPAPPLPIGDRNCNPEGIGFWALVREDFVTNGRELSAPGFWALFWNRFGNWRMSLPRVVRPPATLLYRIMWRLCQLIGGVKLDYTVKVGRRVAIQHFGGMVLGARSIGDDVTIRQNTTFGVASNADLNAKPRIGNRVEIGAGAVIVGDITIGDDVMIGANAVVTKNVPPGVIVGGIPARIIRRRNA